MKDGRPDGKAMVGFWRPPGAERDSQHEVAEVVAHGRKHDMLWMRLKDQSGEIATFWFGPRVLHAMGLAVREYAREGPPRGAANKD